MIKILHSADWHLDAPMTGFDGAAAATLQKESRQIPEKIVSLCKQEACDLLFLAGDLFDTIPSRETVLSVQGALAQLDIPVIITPGNHDFCAPASPYLAEGWSENVHIFKKPEIESIVLPELDCRIYGCGYATMDCPGLLKNFQQSGAEKYQIGVFHADATTKSTYFPITKAQLQESQLDYVALGHIHKQGSITAGKTLCLWPGCPMGRGFDELGEKGVIVAILDETVTAEFIPLDTPRFYDETVDAGEDPVAAIAQVLPAIESSNFYRITVTGYSDSLDMEALTKQFSHIPNLTLRDATIPMPALWENIDSDTLEGMLFAMLKDSADSPSEVLSQRATLAARICRSILDGQEVVLP